MYLGGIVLIPEVLPSTQTRLVHDLFTVITHNQGLNNSHTSVFHSSILSRGGGKTRGLEMLRRGGINHQAVQQNNIKIQGGGSTQDLRGGALGIQGGGACTSNTQHSPHSLPPSLLPLHHVH